MTEEVTKNCHCYCHARFGDCNVCCEINESYNKQFMHKFVQESINIKNFILDAQTNITKCFEDIEKLRDESKKINDQKFSEFHYLTPRVEKIEHFFSGKVKNPIYDAIEAHIENFNKRVEKLERLCDTINAHQHGAEGFVKKVSNELDQDLGLAIERLDELEHKVEHNEAFVATISSNFVSPRSMEIFVQANVENIFRHIESLEQQVKILEESRIKLIAPMQRVTREEFAKQYPDAEEEPIEIKLHQMQQNIDCLFLSMKGVEGKVAMATSFRPIKPHKCPVCEGKGLVFLMISITESHQAICQPCEGKGIVWG